MWRTKGEIGQGHIEIAHALTSIMMWSTKENKKRIPV
jgi:hypothetical protein